MIELLMLTIALGAMLVGFCIGYIIRMNHENDLTKQSKEMTVNQLFQKK
jgi:hypothetical protein